MREAAEAKMSTIKKIMIIMLLMTSIVGCALLKSERTSFSRLSNKMVYCLPKGMIKLQIKPATNGGSDITAETHYVPDPNHYYTLSRISNPSYEDKIHITLTNE